jgi:hypothetical protein
MYLWPQKPLPRANYNFLTKHFKNSGALHHKALEQSYSEVEQNNVKHVLNI